MNKYYSDSDLILILMFKTSDHSVCVCLLCSDNPSQIGSVSVAIRIMDINDNPPSLIPYYEAFVCENAKAGQVRPRIAKKHTHTHSQGPNF